jgi:hypothetical protein
MFLAASDLTFPMSRKLPKRIVQQQRPERKRK